MRSSVLYIIYRVARYLGRRLPLPVSFKVKARSVLVRMQQPKELRRGGAAGKRLPLATLVNAKRDPMRPECCGLVPDLVSVVLPVYNQAELLPESVHSVLTQSYTNFELILINDGSEDGAEELLERYSSNPRVRCFTQANLGLPKALSNGFSFARGEFWTWTSADNIMEPHMLEQLVAKLRSEPDWGMVYADYYAIDDRSDPLQDGAWRWQDRPDLASGEIRPPRTTEDLNIVRDNFIGPCFLYRGWIGRVLGDYTPQMGIEDYDYWMRINAFFPIHHLGSDELLYHYRVHDNTLSAQSVDLAIFDKSRHLIKFEQARAVYFQSNLEIMVDDAGKSWLHIKGGRHRIKLGLVNDGSSSLDSSSLGTVDGKAGSKERKADLFVIGYDTAMQHAESLLAMNVPIAIIFDSEGWHHPQLQRLLRRAGCIALAPDKKTADRIRLVSSCPVLDLAARQSPLGVVAYARNFNYFHQAWSAKQLARPKPKQLVQTKGQHLALQVDSFTQGGMENVVIDLAFFLMGQGFEVTIVNLGQAGDAVAKAVSQGLRVESLGGLSEAGASKAPSPQAYLQWLRQEGVTLVNAHYSLFAAEECQQAGMPFIVTVHNAYVWLEPKIIQQYQQMDASITAYTCVSNTAASYAHLALGLDVTKMRVIPNGIESTCIDENSFEDNRRTLRQRWGVSSSTSVFLNVASIMATKAQLPLVKAFGLLLEQHPDARLVLLGEVMEETYLHQIKQTVHALGIADKVIFAGYCREVGPYYQAADVFVLPSYWEGWSLSLGEAMVSGLNCVVTDVGSAYEFAEHPRVELIAPPFGDVTALNYQNLAQWVYGEDQQFIEAIAAAMRRATRNERQPKDVTLAKQLDRQLAYPHYAALFNEFLVSSAPNA